MVKLRVTARILPETEYLAHIDSNAQSTLPIHDEKRFHVVVQEPEKWYIGTLAVAVRQKYQSLYKHDLGRIKYLKADEDDCDLDPEEGVLELLVDEGRALTDRSDQHVTIKVIREQGRAIRQGSVIPDLTPVHYQLPSRPPVPRFEEVGSSLGKRDAERAQVDVQPTKRQRTKLSEIEEDNEPVATIEQDLTAEAVIENSQPSQESVRLANGFSSSSTADDHSHTGWSFTQLGPPTMLGVNTSDETSVEEIISGSSSKDPGSHKRFLKPLRDVYSYPESDIDDSQASIIEKQPQEIIPRMITSSGEQQHINQTSLSNNTSNKRANASKPKVSGAASLAESNISDLSNGTRTHAADSDMAMPTGSSSLTPKAPRARRSRSIAESTMAESGANSQDAVNALNAVKSQVAIADSTAQLAQKPSEKRKRNRKSVKTEPSKGSKATLEAGDQSPDQTEHLKPNQKTTRTNTSAPVKTGGRTPSDKRQYRTPTPDSPSEQLSQSLQESARKSMSIQSASHEELSESTPRQSSSRRENIESSKPEKGRLGLGITDSPRKPKQNKVVDTVKAGSKAGAQNPPVQDDTTSVEGSKIRKHKRRPTKVTHEQNHDKALEKPPAQATLGIPSLARALSTESNGAKTTGAILPPGMTQAEFDRLVASHVPSKTDDTSKSAKKRGTPSLARSVSKSSEPATSTAPAGQPDLNLPTGGTKAQNVDADLNEQTPNAATKKQNEKASTKKKAAASEENAKVVTAEVSTPTEQRSKPAATMKSNIKDATPQEKAIGSKSATLSTASQPVSGSEASPSATTKDTTQKMPPPTSKSAKTPSVVSKSTPKTSTKSTSISASTSSSAKPRPLPSSQPTPTPKAAATNGPTKRPTLAGPNSLYQARSLKELAKISGSAYNSPSASIAGSPATSTQNRTSFLGKAAHASSAQKKKSLFNNEDSSDDSTSSDSDSNSTSDSDSSSRPTAGAAATNSARSNKLAPAIRDVSVDDDSDSEGLSGDASSAQNGSDSSRDS